MQLPKLIHCAIILVPLQECPYISVLHILQNYSSMRSFLKVYGRLCNVDSSTENVHVLVDANFTCLQALGGFIK